MLTRSIKCRLKNVAIPSLIDSEALLMLAHDSSFSQNRLSSCLSKSGCACDLVFCFILGFRLPEVQSQPGRRRRRQLQSQLQPVTTQSIIDLTVSDNEDEEMVPAVGDTSYDFGTTDLQHAHLFRLLSWNIDGLSIPSVGFRTPEVIKLIRR